MNTILVQSIIGLLTFIAAVLSSVFIPIILNKKAKYASYIMDSTTLQVIKNYVFLQPIVHKPLG